MANEVIFTGVSGESRFIVVWRKSDLQVWFPDVSGSGAAAAWESWGDSSHTLSDYGIEATTVGGDLFAVDMISAAEAVYLISAYQMVGDDPDDGDAHVKTFEYLWTGTAEESASLQTILENNHLDHVAEADTGRVNLIDAPNATAVTAIQLGLATPGDEMDLIDAPNGTAVTAIQSGLATPAAVVTALQDSTGWTQGGTYTLAAVVEYIAAFTCGDQIDKTGSTTIKQVYDIEGALVTADVTYAASSPYRSVSWA